MNKQYYVYIMTSKQKKVLYTGVTNNLKKRIYEHKTKSKAGFTKKYNINSLIYYEIFNDMYNAIAREKQIKAGSRQKKFDLINSMNPSWKDLYNDL
jgi:putative endonuclease